MYCNKCGRENEEDNIFCEYCGAKLAEEDDTESCCIDGEEANDESADAQETTGTSRDSDGHEKRETRIRQIQRQPVKIYHPMKKMMMKIKL